MAPGPQPTSTDRPVSLCPPVRQPAATPTLPQPLSPSGRALELERERLLNDAVVDLQQDHGDGDSEEGYGSRAGEEEEEERGGKTGKGKKKKIHLSRGARCTGDPPDSSRFRH